MRKLLVGMVIFTVGVVAGLSGSALASSDHYSAGGSSYQTGNVLASEMTIPQGVWTDVPDLTVPVCGNGQVSITVTLVGTNADWMVRVLVNQQVALPASLTFHPSQPNTALFLAHAGSGRKSVHVQVYSGIEGDILTAGLVNALGAFSC